MSVLDREQNQNAEKNWKRHIVLIVCCVIINFAGKAFASLIHAPFWLDAIGTALSAYIAGPWAGLLCGAMTNMSYSLLEPTTLAYTLTSMAIGVTTGLLAKRGMMQEIFGVICTSFIVGIISVIISTPLNLIIWNGKCGNVWGDGLYDMLADNHAPQVLCTILGEAFIDIPDKVITLFVVYLTAKFIHSHKKTAEAMTVTAFMICSMAFAVTDVQAAEIQNEDYIKILFNSENKMASSEANDIVQTGDGYIWVGSYAGLYRYDGIQFSMIGREDNITNVTTLFVDRQGRLIVGTNDSGVGIYEDGTFTLYGIDQGMASNSIRSIAQGQDGELYIGTTGLLSVLNPDGTVTVLDEIPDITYVNSMTDEKDGILSGVTNDGQVFFLKDGELIHKEASDENVDEYYTCIYRNMDDEFIVGTSEKHLVIYRVNGDRVSRGKNIYISGLSSIHSISNDQDGTIWICADDGLGYLTQGGRLVPLEYTDFGSSVESMMQDYEGNYWFASSRLGILELTRNSFLNVGEKAGLGTQVVNSTCMHNRLMYIGSDEGLSAINEKSNVMVSNELTRLLDGVRVRCLMEDSQGNLWASTYGSDGLVCYTKDEKIKKYNETEGGTMGGRFRSTLEMKDGTIVAASSTGLSFIEDGRVTGTLGEADGLTNPQILSMAETEDHLLFAGSDGDGLFIIKDKKIIRNITYDDGLPSQIILRISAFKDGYLLVTSNSLCFMNQDGQVRQIENFPYANNLDAWVMKDDTVWILSSGGIYIIDSDSLYEDREDMAYHLLGSMQGLKTSLTANSWNYMDADGWLYLSCAAGVRKIQTTQYQSYIGDYMLALNSLTTDAGIIRADEEGVYQLSQEDKRVIFEPVVLDYTLNNPYVRYSLVGFDDQAITVRQSELSQIVYTNLPSGSYQFRFAVLDEDTMQPLKQLVVSVNKEKQFYEHTWFYAYLIFVLLFFVTFVTWALTRISNLSLIKQQYDQIRTARDEAESANRAKSMFLANMSHEIRAPMNAVIGMSEIALKENVSETVKEELNNILGASKKLLGIINDILDFSKIESGKMEIVESEYSLAAMIHDVANIITFRLQGKDVALIMQIEDAVPDQLIGDEMRVRQILINLLNNAVKFTDKGSITLSIKPKSGEAFALLIDVKDTGCGIKEEDKARLFKSFERVENSSLHSVEGTGLGLSICKNMLDLMGGAITVESRYTEGTVFHIVLPQKVAEHSLTYGQSLARGIESVQKLEEKEAIIFQGASVLIVDDNELNLKVAKGLLKEYKMDIELAQSGQDCIRLVQENTYDLILLDHVMPQMDGIETLHKLKELERFHTPVVALTANAVNGAMQMYEAEGFADYLSKPMEQEEILRVLKRFLFDKQQKAGLDTKKEQGDSMNIIDSKSALLSRLQEEGLNTEAAMRFMGNNEEQYVEILQMFIQDAPEKIERLEAFYAQENWHEYAILVHALKSNSRSLGADEIADRAFALEKASKSADAEFVKENHEDFVFEYQMLLAGLRYVPQLGLIGEMLEQLENQENTSEAMLSDGEAAAQPAEEEASDYTQEQFQTAIEQIAGQLDDFETDAAKKGLEDILKHALSAAQRKLILAAKKAVDEYDYDKAMEILRS